MPEMNALNPALANLLQVASMVTPEQTPTVAAQVVGAATQQPAPMQGGMPPGLRDITQDAMMGNQVQMHQQQQQQQAMQQALQQLIQQQQGQDNAMRFGVAAAPGAQSVRMAEGGIVGYAEAGDVEDVSLPERVRKALMSRVLQSKLFAEEPPEVAQAAGPGILDLIKQIPGQLGQAAMSRVLQSGLFADTASRNAPPVSAAPYPEPARVRESQPPAAPTADTTTRTTRPGPARQPAPAQAGIGALMPQQPMGPSAVDLNLGEARRAISEMETAAPSPETVRASATATASARDAFLRSQGLDPEQYKRDIEASQAREARKLQGLGQLEARVRESRTGIDGLIRLLGSAAGRTDPLAAIGAQYGRNVAQDLAEDERFMRARDQVMDSEEAIRTATRNARIAEAKGDFNTARTEAAAAQQARNAQRKAVAEMALETAKLVSGKEEKDLDRRLSVQIEQMRAQLEREKIAAMNAGTAASKQTSEMLREAGILSKELTRVQNQYNADMRMLMADPTIVGDPKLRAARERQIEAARDNALAEVHRRSTELQGRIMGVDTSGVTVTPLPKQ